MAKDVKFKIDLIVDGQKHLIEATTNSKRLAHELGLAEDKTYALKDAMNRWANGVMGLQAVQSSLAVLSSQMSSLTSESKNYDTAMRAANTMAGKGAEDFGKLKDEVTELSKSIPIARDALANGLYQVISNGVPENNWIEYLRASARSSVGGIADLGQVVGVTSTIIKNYGLEWSAAKDVQDKIQLTAKNGVTSFEQLAAALPKVSSNAATLGVSIDELMATFATLTGVSGNTAEVSTQLAAIFTALIKPSNEATKIAEAMGIQFNSASVNAAGGLQQFLTKLDQAVKTYAAAHGILEKEVYGKLFGSAESLRALGPLTGNLAKTFQSNIATMAESVGTMDGAFGEMASTAEAKAQLVKNSFAGIRDSLASLFSNVSPYLSFAATVGTITLSLESMRKSIFALWKTITSWTVVTKLQTAATAAQELVIKAWAAAVQFANHMQIAWTFGAKAFVIQSVAVRAALAAMIPVGIGLAIAGLIAVVQALTSSLKGSAAEARGVENAMESLKRAEDEGAQQAAAVKTEIDGEIEKLAALIKSKGDATAAVNELNKKYGDWFGYCKTAKEWYDVLVAGSKDYCDQLRIEGQMRVLQQRQNELYIKSLNNSRKGQELKDSGDWGTNVWGVNNSATQAVINEYKEIEAEQKMLSQEMDKLKSQQQQYTGVVVTGTRRNTTPTYTPSPSITSTAKTGKTPKNTPNTPNTDNTPKLTRNATTYKQLADNVAYYSKQLENANITEKEAYEELVKKKTAAETAVEAYNRMVEGIADLQKYEKDASSIEGMQTNVDVLRRQLSRTAPNSKEWQEVTDAINEWQNKLDGIEKGSMSSIERTISRIDEELKNRNLDMDAEVKLRTTRYNLQRQLDDRSKNVAFKVEIEGREGNMSDIDKAIQFYTDRQQTEDADNVRKTQDIIDGLTKKRRVFELSVELADKSREIRDIEELTKKEQVIKIRGLGFEELTNRIKELSKLLADTENPITDGQRKEIERIIGVYQDWRKQSVSTFDALRDGWSGIKGLGNGIKSMSDALKGNGDAWSKVTSVVDGFLSIYESVRGISKVIDMLTMAAQTHTASKVAEAGAVTSEVGAEDAANSTNLSLAASETAASKVETAAFTELAAAKYLAAHAYIPFAGFGIGAGFATAAKGLVTAMGSISAFADGGIAFGPTVGLFGEYPGARSNPEVVAPLDKLRDYVQPQSLDGDVRFIIDGDKLVGILNKRNRHTSRI